MFNKTKIALSAFILFGSASASFALDRHVKTHRATAQFHRVVAPERYAARAEVRTVRRPASFERIWFRLAEGPEWN
jgi:hypothetical protein